MSKSLEEVVDNMMKKMTDEEIRIAAKTALLATARALIKTIETMKGMTNNGKEE